MKNKNVIVDHLSEELHHWIWTKVGDRCPSREEIENFILQHFDKFGIIVQKDTGKVDEQKIGALLKPTSSESTRMRELAGIPHKKNFL